MRILRVNSVPTSTPPVIDMEYRIGNGPAVSLGAVVAGDYPIDVALWIHRGPAARPDRRIPKRRGDQVSGKARAARRFRDRGGLWRRLSPAP